MSDAGPACGAVGALSAVHLDALARLAPAHPGSLRAVLGAGPELRCALGRHTGPHMDVLHEGPAEISLWARWSGTGGAGGAGGGDAVLALPDCPAADGGEACGQYRSHPGGHTWEITDPGTEERGRSGDGD
ncbi:hypothetical protein SAVIM338S_04330 [Streptomyces avidinii]